MLRKETLQLCERGVGGAGGEELADELPLRMGDIEMHDDGVDDVDCWSKRKRVSSEQAKSSIPVVLYGIVVVQRQTDEVQKRTTLRYNKARKMPAS